jgi:mannose-1-phosphate guanylyltransferase
MKRKYSGLIMAGGQGTRFWPYSTKAVPKQFLNIIGDQPLILQTFDRLKTFIDPDEIYIVADNKYLELTQKAIPGFRESNFIAEPSPRNTAPSLIRANNFLSRKDENSNILVVPADHFISDIDTFSRQMRDALDYADNPCLITAGIKPTIAHTGYGYIRFNPSQPARFNQTDFFRVGEFKEKPKLNLARKYLQRGNYFWNSGMFVYKLKFFREFLATYNPYYADFYEKLNLAYGDRKKFIKIFNRMKPDSIDYALMEKAKEVRMFSADFGWNDVGAWSSVYELNPKDRQNNVKVGDHIAIECRNSLLFSTRDIPIAAIGLDGMVVIHTESGILVAPLHELQKVKDIRRFLK